MINLKDLHTIVTNRPTHNQKMPVLFVGHGSPMNGIEDNDFSRRWSQIGTELPVPNAILCISAHWFTRGTFITAMERPQTIHDFYGFPQELFDVHYPAPGDPILAKETSSLIKTTPVGLDHEWGLDHGCWTVVQRMYPDANIPVLQLSIDGTKLPEWHYDLAKEISSLRSKGILIIGSGNIIHNLRMIDWNNPDSGFDWANEMNENIKRLIIHEEHKKILNYPELGPAAMLSIPTPEHYLPLLYVLGLKEKNENISLFNDRLLMGSVSMTSVKVGS